MKSFGKNIDAKNKQISILVLIILYGVLEYQYIVFDILIKKTLKLLEHPLIAMEVAMKLIIDGLEEFERENIWLSGVVKQFNGDFVILEHNRYILGSEWKEFNRYELIIKCT